jgi:hypothetical protein
VGNYHWPLVECILVLESRLELMVLMGICVLEDVVEESLSAMLSASEEIYRVEGEMPVDLQVVDCEGPGSI